MVEQSLTELQVQYDIPAWGKWLAQDADGKWWVYSVEPLQHSKGWYENEVGQYLYLGRLSTRVNWKESLISVTT